MTDNLASWIDKMADAQKRGYRLSLDDVRELARIGNALRSEAKKVTFEIYASLRSFGRSHEQASRRARQIAWARVRSGAL